MPTAPEPDAGAEPEQEPLAIRPEPGAEAEPEQEGAAIAPEPPPAVTVPEALVPVTRVVVGRALDAVAGASADLRRASFYIGSTTLGLLAPYVLLLWALEVAATGRTEGEVIALVLDSSFTAPLGFATMLAGLGLGLAFIESRNVAQVLVAAHLAAAPVSLRQAVQRSRRVFWRTVLATVLVNVPLYAVQLLAVETIAPAFGVDTEVTVVTAILVSAILFSPLAYAIVGIVVGDVTARQGLVRSIRLFRARPALGLVVALVATGAQFLLGLGLATGLELVFVAADLLGIGAASGTAAVAVATAGLVVLTFAIGTLVFTVSALTAAPAVGAFLALTRVAPGLDAIRRPPAPVPSGTGWATRPAEPRFRWLTRPLWAAVVLGALVVVAGVSALGR